MAFVKRGEYKAWRYKERRPIYRHISHHPSHVFHHLTPHQTHAIYKQHQCIHGLIHFPSYSHTHSALNLSVAICIKMYSEVA